MVALQKTTPVRSVNGRADRPAEPTPGIEQGLLKEISFHKTETLSPP
jgi:hypothetical protein